jgi:hypothetical protein
MMKMLLEWKENEKYDFLLSSYMHLALQCYIHIHINLYGIFFSIMKKQRLQRKLKLMKDELGRSLRNKRY